MRTIVLQFIVGTAGLLLFLIAVIIVNKALRELREAIDRDRRAALEPVVAAYLGSADAMPILTYLPRRLGRRDRRLVEALLAEASTAGAAPGEAVRARAAAAFEALGSVDRALRDLDSRRWWKRAAAAERLGVMRSSRAAERLVKVMGDEVGEVRMRAAAALGLIRGATSIRPLVAALSDPSRWSAIRVAEILVGVGHEAVDELLPAWDSLPLHARLSALDILARLRTPRARDLMRRCLADPAADIRARAAHGLGLIGDIGAVEALQEALRDHAWPVRAMAAKALGRIGSQAAVPALARALEDREWWVRANAGEALRRLGDAGRTALIDMLDAADPYARHQAVAQLEEGGVLDGWIADLGSPDETRRAAALRVIEKIIALGRTDHLAQQAAAIAEDGVRRFLVEALRRAAPADDGGGGEPVNGGGAAAAGGAGGLR
jgi:HEAT repeat protein